MEFPGQKLLMKKKNKKLSMRERERITHNEIKYSVAVVVVLLFRRKKKTIHADGWRWSDKLTKHHQKNKRLKVQCALVKARVFFLFSLLSNSCISPPSIYSSIVRRIYT